MNRENNYTKELDQDKVGLIEEYKEKGKLHPDFLPFVTYDMVQLGYPKPDHRKMIARDRGGSDSEGRMLPSDGKWCKVEDVLKLINQSLPKEAVKVPSEEEVDKWIDLKVKCFPDLDGISFFTGLTTGVRWAIKRIKELNQEEK